MFRDSYLKRSRRLYHEAIFNLAFLRFLLLLRDVETELDDESKLELLKGEFDILDGLPPVDFKMPEGLKLNRNILRIEQLNWANYENNGIRITDEGVTKLQSGELQREIAALNIGIQNIYLQRLVMMIGLLAIVVQIMLAFYISKPE